MLEDSLSYDLLWVLTAMIIASMLLGYRWSRDPFHPAILLGLLFMFSFVLETLQAFRHPDFTRFLPNPQPVQTTLLIYITGLGALFAGLLSIRLKRSETQKLHALNELVPSDVSKTRLISLAYLLAAIALAAYWYGIFNVGGFMRAYATSKGGGFVGSGYVGEASLLAYPAVIIFALSWSGRKLGWFYWLVILVMSSPGLLHGIFGGRRGPLFITLSVMFFSWCIARGKAPRLRLIIIMGALFVAAVLFVQSQRKDVYFGSENKLSMDRFLEMLREPELDAGHNFIHTTGAINAARVTNFFHWGRRFFTIYLVRPIPRQIWPTKYEDASRFFYSGESSISDSQWDIVNGWFPIAGSAVNSIADLYLEFKWFGVLGCWLLGRFLGICWKNFRLKGGFWTLIFFSTSILSLYLPTQSLSAFLHRFLYINIVTYLIWWLWLGKPGVAAPVPETGAEG